MSWENFLYLGMTSIFMFTYCQISNLCPLTCTNFDLIGVLPLIQQSQTTSKSNVSATTFYI